MDCLPIATQPEAEDGALNDKMMTPLRVKQAIDALGVSQTTLSSSAGGAMVGFEQTGSGSVTRDMSAKLSEIVSLSDKGAATNGTDATTAINNALATSRHVDASSGNYRAANISFTEDGQVLSARGSVNIIRNANGALINSAASDLIIDGVAFYGDDTAYAGDLLTFTGQRGKLIFSSARDGGSSKALKITGSSWLIFGANDVYDGNVQITTDGVGGVSQYHNLLATRVRGSLSLVDTSFVSVIGCLVAGPLTVDKGAGTAGGHGARILSTRLTGPTTITQSNTCIGSGASASSDVTIGDGSSSYSGIAVDPSFVQQTGASFTIHANVKGTFHLGNIVADDVVVTIPSSVRQVSNIYHGEIDYTPVISGGGGSFSVGDGSLIGKFSQQGNVVVGRCILTIGSTTALPASGLFTTIPVNCGGRPIVCQIEVFKPGYGSFGLTGHIFSDGLRILGRRSSPTGPDELLTATYPTPLDDGDVVTWAFVYQLAGV